MSRKVLMVALLLPLLVILLGIAKAEWHLAHARTWAFDITGYDPRDLLRGHYLQYRLVLHESEPLEPCREDLGEACCFCLTATAANAPPKVQRARCERARASCEGLLQTRYLKQLERYLHSRAGRAKARGEAA